MHNVSVCIKGLWPFIFIAVVAWQNLSRDNKMIFKMCLFILVFIYSYGPLMGDP